MQIRMYIVKRTVPQLAIMRSRSSHQIYDLYFCRFKCEGSREIVVECFLSDPHATLEQFRKLLGVVTASADLQKSVTTKDRILQIRSSPVLTLVHELRGSLCKS